MPILKIDWDIAKAYIHGTPWQFHTFYKKRWSEETHGSIQCIKHLLYLRVGSIQFSILSKTQDLDFLVTTALLSWIIQVFAEGTASLKALDKEYTRTFEEQRQVCQKGTWVERMGEKKGSCRPSVSFQPPSIRFYSLWRKRHGRPMIWLASSSYIWKVPTS